jgi:hypothetical protein
MPSGAAGGGRNAPLNPMTYETLASRSGGDRRVQLNLQRQGSLGIGSGGHDVRLRLPLTRQRDSSHVTRTCQQRLERSI